MTPEDCENLRALQSVVAEPSWSAPSERSFEERKDELKRLLEEGAAPALCCKKEQKRIQGYLDWTDSEIAELDEERLIQLEEREAKRDEEDRAWGRSWPPEDSDSE